MVRSELCRQSHDIRFKILLFVAGNTEDQYWSLEDNESCEEILNELCFLKMAEIREFRMSVYLGSLIRLRSVHVWDNRIILI